MTRLVILLAPVPHWLRLAGETVVAQGDGLPLRDPDAELTLAVPGEHVGLAWIDLPALAPAQAAAAARLLIADRVAPSPESLHVVAATGAGVRPVAWIDPLQLEAWLAELAQAGLEPDSIIPDIWLLPAPEPGSVNLWQDGDRLMGRGAALGLAGEAALVALLIEGLTPNTVTDWRPGLADRLARPPLDLRQGQFARRRSADTWRWRRLAALAAAAAVLWLGADAAAWLRASLAAELIEQQLADTARAALPRGALVTAASALPQLHDRAARLGAIGGFTGAMLPLAGSLAAQPQARLGRIDYAVGAGVSATLAAGNREAVLAAIGGTGVGATAVGPQEIKVALP